MKKMFFLGTALGLACLLMSCQSFGVGDVISGLTGGGGSSSDQSRAAGGCGAPFAGDSGGGSASKSKGQGETVNVSWPADDEWDNYGLKGLKQPAGSKVVNVALYQGVYYIGLEEAGKEAYADLVAQIKKITGATAPYSLVKSENGELSEYKYGDHLVSLAVEYVEKEIIIRILR